MSFPPGTEMFQFPGFASNPLWIQGSDTSSRKPVTESQTSRPGIRQRTFGGGFPHSEIRGSKLVRSSSRLIAAYHVLHSLRVPRHPPNALKALDRSHYRCPPVPGPCDPREERPAFLKTRAPTGDRVRPHRLDRRYGLQPRRRADDAAGKTSVTRELPVGEAVKLRQLSLVPAKARTSGQLFSSRCQRTGSTPRGHAANQSFLDKHSPAFERLVEPDGIEPTTSCLQSRRSPN